MSCTQIMLCLWYYKNNTSMFDNSLLRLLKLITLWFFWRSFFSLIFCSDEWTYLITPPPNQLNFGLPSCPILLNRSDFTPSSERTIQEFNFSFVKTHVYIMRVTLAFPIFCSLRLLLNIFDKNLFHISVLVHPYLPKYHCISWWAESPFCWWENTFLPIF